MLIGLAVLLTPCLLSPPAPRRVVASRHVPPLMLDVVTPAELHDMGQVIEAVESAYATDVSDAIVSFRTQLSQLRLPVEFPTLPPAFRTFRSVGFLRDLVTEVLDFVRPAAVLLTVVSAIVAVSLGLLLGDRSTPPATVANMEADALLLARMPDDVARRWDAGEYCDPLEGCEIPSDEAPRVSAGLWLELAFCVLLDFGGLGSYFFSSLGEVSDVGFAGGHSALGPSAAALVHLISRAR